MSGDDAYGTRYVAFLDILGFSNLVQRADEPEWRSALIDVVMCLRGTLANNPHIDFRATQFSDCIVVSAPAGGTGIRQIFQGVTMLATNLMQRAILLRGGIVKGNMLHTDEVLLGPALVAAHNMDASGGPPRIVLSDEVVEGAREAEYGEGLTPYIRIDPYDRSPILNTLAEFEHYDHVPYVGRAVLDEPSRAIASLIASQCNMPHPRAVLAKWLWLEQYWNSAVSKKGILPKTTEV